MTHPRVLKAIDVAIRSEINYLAGQGLVRKSLADTVVSLRSTMAQALSCYATTNRIHAGHLVRHIGGICMAHFRLNLEEFQPRPRSSTQSFALCLLAMEKCITDAQYALIRGGTGDAKSHLMDLMGVIYGCFAEFDVEPRQGYEPEDS